jgi:hypothetical protein
MKMCCLLVLFFVLTNHFLFAQTNIIQKGTDSLIFNNAGVTNMVLSPDGSLRLGTMSPIDGSSIMQINSTGKGVLIPRLTGTQMNAIASPASGLLIYIPIALRFVITTAQIGKKYYL